MLTEESRRVQTMGWNFNEEIDVVLIPTVTGEIFVPQNTLRFLYPSDSTIVQRGFRLYDRSLGLVASLPPSPWDYLVGRTTLKIAGQIVGQTGQPGVAGMAKLVDAQDLKF